MSTQWPSGTSICPIFTVVSPRRVRCSRSCSCGYGSRYLPRPPGFVLTRTSPSAAQPFQRAASSRRISCSNGAMALSSFWCCSGSGLRPANRTVLPSPGENWPASSFPVAISTTVPAGSETTSPPFQQRKSAPGTVARHSFSSAATSPVHSFLIFAYLPPARRLPLAAACARRRGARECCRQRAPGWRARRAPLPRPRRHSGAAARAIWLKSKHSPHASKGSCK